ICTTPKSLEFWCDADTTININLNTISATSTGFSSTTTDAFDDIQPGQYVSVANFADTDINTNYLVTEVSSNNQALTTYPAPADTESASNTIAIDGINPEFTQNFQAHFFCSVIDGDDIWSVGWMPKDDTTAGGNILLAQATKKDSANSDNITLKRAWSIHHTPTDPDDATRALRGMCLDIDDDYVWICTGFLPHSDLGDTDYDHTNPAHYICLKKNGDSADADDQGLLDDIGTGNDEISDPANVKCTYFARLLHGHGANYDIVQQTGFTKLGSDTDYIYAVGMSNAYNIDNVWVPMLTRFPRDLTDLSGSTVYYDSYMGKRNDRDCADDMRVRMLYHVNETTPELYPWVNVRTSDSTYTALVAGYDNVTQAEYNDNTISEGTSDGDYFQKSFRVSDDVSHYVEIELTGDAYGSCTAVGSGTGYWDRLKDSGPGEYNDSTYLQSGTVRFHHDYTDTDSGDWPDGSIKEVNLIVRYGSQRWDWSRYSKCGIYLDDGGGYDYVWEETAYPAFTKVNNQFYSFRSLYTDHSGLDSGFTWSWADIEDCKVASTMWDSGMFVWAKGFQSHLFMEVNYSPIKSHVETITGGASVNGSAD
ncbi:MAG: hypothetical protein GY869_19060, partial [Planctomycetes bacterium]|nr:hypothetical protein [Planctomycetota bacterium]